MPISSLAHICSTSSGVTRWLANERTVTMPTKADRPNMVERNLIQAMRDGTALRGTAQRLAREARASKNVTIRMAEADLDLARKQAEATSATSSREVLVHPQWHVKKTTLARSCVGCYAILDTLGSRASFKLLF